MGTRVAQRRQPLARQVSAGNAAKECPRSPSGDGTPLEIFQMMPGLRGFARMGLTKVAEAGEMD
jgi:hypothetical protein